MRETSRFGSRFARGFKKATAGTLAALMVVTALPTNAFTVEAAGAADTKAVFRSYNPNNGEHLYTIDGAEHSANVGRGYKEENTEAWLAPATSGTGVWRVYNPNSGEHLLVPESEANGLAAIGWNNEGLKLYSDDEKGVPIYRVYNKNATDAGAHHYCSKDEGTALVAAGWAWDNNGEPMIYGVDANAKEEVKIESVTLDNTTPKVGDTINAKTTPSNAKVDSYVWYADGKEIKGETKSKLTINSEMVDKAIKVKVTDSNGKSVESEATAAVVENLAGTFELKDDNGLQKDGTARTTDTLRVAYGSDLGTPNNITWYCNGAVMAIYSLANGNLTQDAFNSNDCRSKNPNNQGVYQELQAGTWKVTIQNTEGALWTSNELDVVYEGQAVLSEVSIEDDYESTNPQVVEISKKSKNAILNVKFNKNYKGTLYIINDKYEKNLGSYNNNKVAFTTANGLKDKLDEVKTKANLTDKKASGVGVGKKGIYFEDSTGAIFCKIKVSLDGNEELTRGDKYYLVWDQDDISGDEISGTTEKKDVNYTDSVVMPYVQAPASIKVTSFHEGATEIKAEAYDKNGDILAWWTEANNNDTEKFGMSAIKLFGVDTNAKDKDDTSVNPDSTAVKEGAFTFKYSNAGKGLEKAYAYVQMKTVAGIFAKDSETLESSISESAKEAMTSLEIEESESNPADAIVKFKGLSTKAPGTVYIMQGNAVAESAGAAKANLPDASESIAKHDLEDAVGSAEVKGGVASVTVTNVFAASDMKDENVSDGKNIFVAVYVPDDEDLWRRAYSHDYSDGEGFVLKPEITTVDKSDMTAVLTGSAIGVSTGASIVIGNIQAKDQFGDDWKGEASSDSFVKVDMINKTVTTTEHATAGVSANGTALVGPAAANVAENGIISFVIRIDNAEGVIDKNDGLTAKVEGLKDLTVTIKAKENLTVNGSGILIGTAQVKDGATKNDDNGGAKKLSDAFDID